MGFLPASGMLWQVLASMMHSYEVSSTADAAGTAPSPHAVGLPLILCELAPLNQQFLALLTAHKQSDWPAAYQRRVPGIINILLMWQRAAFRLAATLIEGHQERAEAAAAGGGVGGTFGTGGEQQQSHALSAVSGEGILTSRAVRQLAASPALWAAAWAQLAAFCQGMYTWQGGKLAKTQHSSSSSTNGNSCSSSSKSTSSRSSSIAGNPDFAGMFASLQLSPDHEQVAAVFDAGEISARIEALDIPAKGRPFSETALPRTSRGGFVDPAAFLHSMLTFHDRSVLCEGLSPQEGTSGIRGHGTSSGENSGGSSSSRGRSDSSGSSSSSGGKENGSSSTGGDGDGSRSGEGSSCSSGRIWSSSRGGVAPAAALQLVLEAAVLLGVVDRPRESTAAAALLCTIAKNCTSGPRKCLLATRGGLVLNVLTAAARYNPECFVSVARNIIHIFLDGAGEGAWGSGGTSSLHMSLAAILGPPMPCTGGSSFGTLAS